MSIIPVSRLSRSDLCRLGNNLGRLKRPSTRPAETVHDTLHRRLIGAVNRSLAIVDEKISDLYSEGRVTPEGGVRGR